VKYVGASRTSVTVGTAPLFAEAVEFSPSPRWSCQRDGSDAAAPARGGEARPPPRAGCLRADGGRALRVRTTASARPARQPRDGRGGDHARRHARHASARGCRRGASSAASGGRLRLLLHLPLRGVLTVGRVSVVSPLIATESLWGVGSLPGQARRWGAGRLRAVTVGSVLDRIQLNSMIC
jgi:hypothetical protein